MESRDIYWAKYLSERINKIKENTSVKITSFDKIYDNVFAAGFKPNKVLTFTLRDDLSVAWITAIKKYSNPDIIIYENEGLMNFDDEEFIFKRIGNSRRSIDLIDYYFYWGKKPADVSSKILLRNGFIKELNQVGYCGYVNYEMNSEDIIHSLSEDEMAHFRTIEKRCNNRNTILVLTAFALCEYSDDQFREDGEILSEDRNKIHEYAEMIRNKLKSYRKKYIGFIKYISNKYPDSVIIIKPHPAEYEMTDCIEYYKNMLNNDNVIVLDYALLMGSLLSLSDIVIHYGSTAALEAYIKGIPTILFRDSDYKGNSDLFYSSKEINVTNYTEFDLDIPFIRFEKNDQLLYDLFSYKIGEEYHPSDELIKNLINDSDCSYQRKFKPSKEEYKVSLVLRTIFRKAIRYLISFKVKKFYNIFAAMIKVI